jgi:hypothetical protein
MENEKNKKRIDGGKIVTTLIITLSTAIVFLVAGYWAGTLQGEEDAATEAETLATAVISSIATKTTSPVNTVTSSTSTTNSIEEKKQVCTAISPDSVYEEAANKKGEYCRVDQILGDYAKGLNYTVVDENSTGGGANWIARKKSTGWVIIQETQDMWDCNLLKTNNVPSAILETDSCYNYTTQKEEKYSL